LEKIPAKAYWHIDQQQCRFVNGEIRIRYPDQLIVKMGAGKAKTERRFISRGSEKAKQNLVFKTKVIKNN